MLIIAFTALSLALVAPGGKIAIVGATGNVGQNAVKQLVAKGYKARILLRKEGSAEELTSLPGVEAIEGDVTDQAACNKLVAGCTAILALHGARRTRQLSDFWRNPENDANHAKQINCGGVANLISAARASGTCKRIVRLTGKGETPWSIFSILINGMGSMAKAWNYEGERLLRATDDLEYTIIRPGVMRGDEETDLPASSLALADDGGDLKVTAIPHATIARLAIDSLGYENAGRCTLTAMQSEEPGTGADSWAPLLEGVKADRRTFPGDELLKEHFLAVRVGGAGIVAGLATFVACVALLVKTILSALIGVATTFFMK